MSAIIPIEKSFRIRHRILEALYNNWENSNHDGNLRVGSIRVATETGIHIREIHKYQYLLVASGEITISDNDGQSMMSIQEPGISSFIDKKYLKDGEKALWESIYDKTRIAIPLLALAIAFFTLFSNWRINNRVKVLEYKVKYFDDQPNFKK